jgi:hypothetical protein
LESIVANRTATEHSETVPGVPSVPQYDDSDIVTMRIGGYLGVMPYRQFPSLDAADQRALMVGRRYLGERAAQAKLAKAQKDGEVDKPGKPSSAEFLRSFLASWQPPTDANAEFTTVGSMRADIGRAYIVEKFNLPDTAEGRATVEKNLPAVLVHPRHGEEISRRLAAKLAEYVAPKKRDEKGASGAIDDSKIASLDLDAA